MAQTLEKRVEQLERKVSELSSYFADQAPRRKDWRRTFGMSRDDQGFKEMMQLGREYRRSIKDNGSDADENRLHHPRT